MGLESRPDKSEEERAEIARKISNTLKGKLRYVNKDGQRITVSEHPGEGWQRGMNWKPPE
jgi:hypothetical protein